MIHGPSLSMRASKRMRRTSTHATECPCAAF